MRDDIQRGVLATMIAAPLMIVCCGGGGAALTAITGAVDGLFGGFGGLAVAITAAVAALIWRGRRRARADCCDDGVPLKGAQRL
jgi:hypothetical protein